jgi:hypothetical protein
VTCTLIIVLPACQLQSPDTSPLKTSRDDEGFWTPGAYLLMVAALTRAHASGKAEYRVPGWPGEAGQAATAATSNAMATAAPATKVLPRGRHGGRAGVIASVTPSSGMSSSR